MNENQKMLTDKLNQLEELLKENPTLTHVYFRRSDGVLVDVTKDQARLTLTRHADWQIENEQPINTKQEFGGVQNNPWEAGQEQQAVNEPEPDTEVPLKPSEEKKVKRTTKKKE